MNKIQEENKTEYKYIRILAMIYITFLMAATVMAYKIVDINGCYQPGSTLIYTSTFFLGNVYAELYGPKYAKKLIWETIFCGYIFALLITIINNLPSPTLWNKKDEYDQVFGHILRFTNAGVVGFLLSSFLNTYLITQWKYKLNGKLFWARSLLASSLSEGAATFCAGIITFFGMLPTHDILQVMTNALLFKLIYGLLAVWPATFLVYILKRKEEKGATFTSLSFIPFNEK